MKPTPATEFFAALTDLLLGADQHPATVQQPCRKCDGSGQLGSGADCNLCDGLIVTGPARGSMAEFDRKMAAYRAKCGAQKMEDE
jgi:hypothetical protein